MDELEDALRRQVAQPVLAQVAQRGARRQVVADQVGRRRREQHLAAVAGRQQPRQPVQGRGAVGAVAVGVGRAGVQRQPHPQRLGQPGVGPRLGQQRPLGVERRGHRGRGGGEGGQQRVADRPGDDAAVVGDGGAEDRLVAGDGGRHGPGVVAPEAGAALDVGEEEGHRAAREVGRRPWEEAGGLGRAHVGAAGRGGGGRLGAVGGRRAGHGNIPSGARYVRRNHRDRASPRQPSGHRERD